MAWSSALCCTLLCSLLQGARRGRGRENVLRLPIIAAGTVNAVAFWFDLHLDDHESITTGARPPLYPLGCLLRIIL